MASVKRDLSGEKILQSSIRCIARTADVCGEGVVWHPPHDAIYWTDVNRRLLHRLLLSSNHLQTWEFDEPVVALTLTTNPEELLVVLGGHILLWNPESDRRDTILYKLPQWPATRCNDARVDPAGTLWFGTMQNNVAADGSTRETTECIGQLLSLDGSGVVKTWQSGVGIANTIAWSPTDDLMYFGDTLRNEISVYDYDKLAQQISRRRVFSEGFDRGLPDGSAMDSEGFLWNCRYGGGCIVRFAPDGAVDLVIDTAVPNPTTCTFGGSDWKTLYFTSAGEGTQLGGVEDGGIFSMRTHVAGLPSASFRP
ncbi:SMP-30/gluconolactonase/LRE family protein [Granulicella sp. S156]|uniref:SMP-30/gluconolactonase/LRE family protein n=1 Tax=Granulicella sp. S156 TaxID=1747224 RepID=UPI00131C159B|nr:SMP-30/gluconolactonase/LRE family protein [Granulicella sp. S156]